MLPPVLEVYVVHHPDDADGAAAAGDVFAHFHGTAFSGLIGGAVEAYARAEPWTAPDGAPRPIPFPDTPAPNGIEAARLIAVVPVLSLALARHVARENSEDDERGTPGPDVAPGWTSYLQRIVDARRAFPERVGVFPLYVGAIGHESRLAALFADAQPIGAPSGLAAPEPAAELRCRDLAQAIAQLAAGSGARLQVFISHTRRAAPGDEEDVRGLIQLVRDIIADTRLRDFFDARDLQPGRDWAAALREQAAESALLAVRTDLYASRPWCQNEMSTAKRAGMPAVILDSLGRGEERGSFLMDHLPRIPIRGEDGRWSRSDVRRGLNLLVDECLKRALWRLQQALAADAVPRGLAVDWWAPHAPEPITLTAWLRERAASGHPALGARDLRVLHPDPPLGEAEREALTDMLALMGHQAGLDVMTPRGLAARGGYASH